MANLNPDDVLLAVCRVLNHFVDEQFLTKDAAGALKPVAGASQITIGKELRTIAAQDKENGAHSISFIRLQILDHLQDLGFGTVLV